MKIKYLRRYVAHSTSIHATVSQCKAKCINSLLYKFLALQSTMQSPKTISAYLTSKQILPFSSPEQCRGIHPLSCSRNLLLPGYPAWGAHAWGGWYPCSRLPRGSQDRVGGKNPLPERQGDAFDPETRLIEDYMDQIDLSPFTDLSVEFPWHSPCSLGKAFLAFFICELLSLWYLRRSSFEAVYSANPDGYFINDTQLQVGCNNFHNVKYQYKNIIYLSSKFRAYFSLNMYLFK